MKQKLTHRTKSYFHTTISLNLCIGEPIVASTIVLNKSCFLQCKYLFCRLILTPTALHFIVSSRKKQNILFIFFIALKQISLFTFEQERLNILKLIVGTSGNHTGLILHVWKREISLKASSIIKLLAKLKPNVIWVILTRAIHWNECPHSILTTTTPNQNLLQRANLNTKILYFRGKKISNWSASSG